MVPIIAAPAKMTTSFPGPALLRPDLVGVVVFVGLGVVVEGVEVVFVGATPEPFELLPVGVEGAADLVDGLLATAGVFFDCEQLVVPQVDESAVFLVA